MVPSDVCEARACPCTTAVEDSPSRPAGYAPTPWKNEATRRGFTPGTSSEAEPVLRGEPALTESSGKHCEACLRIAVEAILLPGEGGAATAFRIRPEGTPPRTCRETSLSRTKPRVGARAPRARAAPGCTGKALLRHTGARKRRNAASRGLATRRGRDTSPVHRSRARGQPPPAPAFLFPHEGTCARIWLERGPLRARPRALVHSTLER